MKKKLMQRRKRKEELAEKEREMKKVHVQEKVFENDLMSFQDK